MKKFLYALMAFLMMILAACSSTDSKIDRLEKLVNEYIDVQIEIKNGNRDAAAEAQKIDKEIEEVSRNWIKSSSPRSRLSACSQ